MGGGLVSGRLNVEGRVSIVMGIYNGERYISQAIESIVGQTYSDIELILVNDGSSDDSMRVATDILKESDIGYMVYYTNGPNHFTPMGGLWPYIVGAGNSTGEYLSFHSQDDLSHPERFRKLVEGIGDRSLAYSNVVHIDSGGNPIKISGGPANEGTMASIMSDTDHAPHLIFSSTLFRKDIFFKRQCYLIGQYDYEVIISMKLFDKEGYAYVPAPLYYYREHSEQTSRLGPRWDDMVKDIGYDVSDFDRHSGRYTYGYMPNRELKEECRRRIL